MRGDLADRMLPITFDAIAEEDRLEEADLWPDWQKEHPRLLGALLDLAMKVLSALPSVRLDKKPRMADFARVLSAVDSIAKTRGLDRYLAAQGDIAADSLTGDEFVTRIAEVIAAEAITSFEGTAAELLARVTPADDSWRAPKGWPPNPRAVTQRLTRQAPVMRKAGWTIERDDGRNHDKCVRWTVAPPPTRPEKDRNGPPRHPQNPQDERSAGNAGNAGHKSGASQGDHDGSDGLAGTLHASSADGGADLIRRVVITVGEGPAKRSFETSDPAGLPLADWQSRVLKAYGPGASVRGVA